MPGASIAGLDIALAAIVANYGSISLHTGDPGTTGAAEVTGGSYARQTTTWGTPAGAQVTGSQVTLNVPAGVTISYWGLWSPVIAAPSGLGVAAVGSGGTFAANTYYWKVTGINANGETTGSNEVSAAIVLNGSANLTWSALPAGTTGVKVYRGTAAGAENVLVATLGAVTSYTDTGTAGTAATVPAVNTTSGWFDGGQLPNAQTYGSAGTYNLTPTITAAG